MDEIIVYAGEKKKGIIILYNYYRQDLNTLNSLLGKSLSYICLDPVHSARVEPDQVALVLGKPVDWYLQVVELVQDWPPRT